jgi:hypothetical protein
MDGSESTIDIASVLSHNGVKGMKWGIRKDHGHEGEQAKTSKIAKLDKKFEKGPAVAGALFKIHDKAASLTNAHDVARINNKPLYKNADFSHDSPLRQKYYAEHQKAFTNNLHKAAAELGTNASGTKKYTVVSDKNGNWGVSVDSVKHADGAETFTVKVSYDSTGHITGLEMVDPSIAQAMERGSDILEHFGVKGMKWGVKRSSSASPRSEDSQKAMDHRETIKKHGVQALSNHELKDLVTRMELVQKYSNLTANGGGKKLTKVDKGHNAIKKVLAVNKTLADVHKTMNSPLFKGLKVAFKAANSSSATAGARTAGKIVRQITQ